MKKQTYSYNTQHQKLLADTLTPVAIYMRLRDKYPNSFLLESNEYGQRTNSYSFICCNPVSSFKIQDNRLETTFPDGLSHNNSIDLNYDLASGLQDYKDLFDNQETDFPFPVNGVFGYLSYDAVQYFEDIKFRNRTVNSEAKASSNSAFAKAKSKESKVKNIPIAHYQVFQNIIVFDHFHNQVYIFDHNYGSQNSKLQELVSIIEHRDVAKYTFTTTDSESSEMTDEDFIDFVQKGKQHCHRGDVFQIVLSRKFKQPFSGDDFNVYRQLRAINPSPYLFYFDYGNFRIMGSSPEAQLLIKNDTASIQPIAGTYKRTGDDIADLKAAQSLKKDPKETAEHVMLVDLARNDLSRHARNVTVTDYQNIHFYSHVIHMVSKVTGTVNEESKMQLIGDTFPAGTLSGAPKHNAMQLIDTYEKSAREFYGGAIGYLSFDGSFNHAIIIRSILSRNNQLEFRAGAGIVERSNDLDEMNEVYHKTNALRKAIKKANELFK